MRIRQTRRLLPGRLAPARVQRERRRVRCVRQLEWLGCTIDMLQGRIAPTPARKTVHCEASVRRVLLHLQASRGESLQVVGSKCDSWLGLHETRSNLVSQCRENGVLPRGCTLQRKRMRSIAGPSRPSEFIATRG